MTSPLLWLVALGPAALALTGLWPRNAFNQTPDTIGRWAVGAGALTLATAVLTTLAVIMHGFVNTDLVGDAGVGISLYVDALSTSLFCLVSFIGLVVVIYSRNYLAGDPRHARFLRWLCLTLASIMTVIIAGNMLLFALSWILTSVSLHRLLIFYSERPAAVLAARKKFIASRIGDLCLIVSMVLLYGLFGSLEYKALFNGAEALGTDGGVRGAVHAVSLLLVVAALLKSAQFPLHGWLLEVMETPTPVSALLHAGIINAGGFLILRFSNIISLSTPALETMAIVGGFTALFGSAVMLTQTSIKVSLAYSTIGQMGFMMLQCGLGAFSPALLHLIGHSLYKAHAFLTSGSVVELARASWIPGPAARPHPARLAIAVTMLLAVALAVGTMFGATLLKQPGVFATGAVVLLGLTHLVANALDERLNLYVVGRTITVAVLVGLVYFGLQWTTAYLLAGSVPPTESLRGPLDLLIVAMVVLSFGAVTILQTLMPNRLTEPRWQALYTHLANGLYVNTIANRLVISLWPYPPPKVSRSSYAHPNPETGGAS
jgi:NADH:ubiquinone oxidoreductase subunit 5 (subunit L)/multisubunit Na+/H+ antiporter MnhA subunit